MAPRLLMAIGVATLLLGALWNGVDTAKLLDQHQAWEQAVAARDGGATLTDEQEGAISAWEQARGQFKSSPERIQETVTAHTSGYLPALAHVSQINSWWQTWGLYRYFFDIFGMMLIGMALYRWGVLTLERPTRLYLLMLGLGYGIGLSVNAMETRWILDHQFSAVAFAQANVSYDLGRLATTIGHLAALLLFVRSGVLPWLRRSLAAVGQMAVTNYLTHSVVCGILFIGLGWFNQLERHELYYIVFAIWAAQLVISPLWLRHFRFGPVEWLWRYLTYLKRPPFRHAGVPVTARAAA